MKIYMCGKLTGRSKIEIEKEHEPIREAIKEKGWEYFDPFIKESDLLKKRQLCNFDAIDQTIKEVVHIDKEMIKQTNVLLWLTGDEPSHGALWECGYTRYHLVKPIVAIAPKHKCGEQKSWTTTEVDYLAHNYEDALGYIEQMFDTPEKILIWRCNILAKHARAEDVTNQLKNYFKLKEFIKEKED